MALNATDRARCVAELTEVLDEAGLSLKKVRRPTEQDLIAAELNLSELEKTVGLMCGLDTEALIKARALNKVMGGK